MAESYNATVEVSGFTMYRSDNWWNAMHLSKNNFLLGGGSVATGYVTHGNYVAVQKQDF